MRENLAASAVIQIQLCAVLLDIADPLLIGVRLGVAQGVARSTVGAIETLTFAELPRGPRMLCSATTQQHSECNEQPKGAHRSIPVINRTRASSLSSVRPAATPTVIQNPPEAYETVGPA